jgi:hypothetical protein
MKDQSLEAVSKRFKKRKSQEFVAYMYVKNRTEDNICHCQQILHHIAREVV